MVRNRFQSSSSMKTSQPLTNEDTQNIRKNFWITLHRSRSVIGECCQDRRPAWI
jgi:hypothetical protein